MSYHFFFLLKCIKSYIQLFYHVKGYCTYPLAIMLTLVTQFVNEVLYTSRNIKISSTQARQGHRGYLAILKHLVNMAEASKDQTLQQQYMQRRSHCKCLMQLENKRIWDHSNRDNVGLKAVSSSQERERYDKCSVSVNNQKCFTR